MEKIFIHINNLIEKKNFNDAQIELSKLGSKFHENPEYLYLRSKIFYLNKLYYIAIDTLLIALEFEKNNKFYDLLSKIYDVLGNKELSKQLADANLKSDAAESLKDQLSGIYTKKN